MLRREDRVFLERTGYTFDVQDEGGMTCVVIHDYRLPPGFNRTTCQLLLRLPGGFPDTQPDMFWVLPPVVLAATGRPPAAAEHNEPHLGQTWQRFSRHLAQDAWRSGIDNLETWFNAIGSLLRKDAGQAAA